MAEKTEKISRQTILAIIATGLFGFTGILTETSMNVTFPELMQNFNITIGTVQWITTAYLLTVALTMTVSAYLKNIMSPRTIFYAALIFFVIGDVLAIASSSFTLLLVGRIIQGAGTGIVTPLLFNIILEYVPFSKVGQYMGFGTMILSLAPAFGPMFGGMVAYYLPWRAIFWLVLPVALISFLLGMKNIPTTKPTAAHREFDFLRFILLGISFSTFLYGLNTVEHGDVSVAMVANFAIAVVAFGLFIYRSKHSDKMFLNINIISNKALRFSLLAYFIYQFTNLAVNFMIPTYIQLVLGSTTLIAGFALMPGSLVGALMNPVFGQMYDEHGPKRPLLLGNAIFAAVVLLYSIIAQNMVVWVITLVYVFLTVGRSMAFGNSMATGLSQIDPKDRPDGNAIYNTAQQFAGAIGTTIASLFLKVDHQAAASVATQTARGTQKSFIFILVLAVINFGLFGLTFKFLQPTKK